eukprot:PhF_6_TR26954/c0_g1_i3/m.39304
MDVSLLRRIMYRYPAPLRAMMYMVYLIPENNNGGAEQQQQTVSIPSDVLVGIFTLYCQIHTVQCVTQSPLLPRYQENGITYLPTEISEDQTVLTHSTEKDGHCMVLVNEAMSLQDAVAWGPIVTKWPPFTQFCQTVQLTQIPAEGKTKEYHIPVTFYDTKQVRSPFDALDNSAERIMSLPPQILSAYVTSENEFCLDKLDSEDRGQVTRLESKFLDPCETGCTLQFGIYTYLQGY